MQNALFRWTPILAALILSAIQLQCLLVPDDTATGTRIDNQPPSVRITSGASTDDPGGISYKVLFRWNGIDNDGVVAAYEWAMDDTISESAWTDTTGFSAVINFDATTYDEQSDPESASFTDWHTFFIRAVDNEFLRSQPDVRFFNARTIAPTSEITFPILTSSTAELQRTLILQWEGEDLDSSQPDQSPVAWEFKLVRIRQLFQDDEEIRDSLRFADNLLLDTLRVGSKKAWVRAPFEQSTLKLEDLPGAQNLTFAVRAIDEAGAVEPFLERGRNMLPFGVRNEPGVPRVTINEPTAGQFTFAGSGQIWDIAVPTNRELRFRWSGDASHYGSLPGNSNYALDTPDVEDDSIRDPDGVGGWIGWGTWNQTNSPIVFGEEDGGTTHNFWVKMRDISDDEASEIVCQVRIYVVPFTFENFALIVDDAKFAAGVSDAEHDAFLRETVTRRFYDLGQVEPFALYPGSPERTNYVDLTLEDLARYQHVFWSVQVGAGNPQPLRFFEGEEGRLTSYAAAGGRLFFAGGRISSYMLGGPNGRFGYPKDPPLAGQMEDFGNETFIWQFMKYHNTIVSVPTRGASSIQKQATGLVGLRSHHPAYPDLELDNDKIQPFDEVSGNQFRGGIKDWEGVKGVVRPVEQIAGFDSLYSPVTMDTTLCCGFRSGGVKDAIVAHRYASTAADTIAGTQQGRTVIFNFQPYWFEKAGLLDAGTAAINWLVTGQDH